MRWEILIEKELLEVNYLDKKPPTKSEPGASYRTDESAQILRGSLEPWFSIGLELQRGTYIHVTYAYNVDS